MGDFLSGVIACVAFSQTLYFLCEVRKVRVIKIKTMEDLLTASARVKKSKTTSVYRLGLLYKHIFHGRPRVLVEYQVTRDKSSNMPKIYYNSCLISKSRKTRYTNSYPEVDVNEVRRTRLSFPVVQRAMFQWVLRQSMENSLHAIYTI